MALNNAYYHELCQPWRRWLSLKSLRALRLRSYIERASMPPVVEETDPMLMQDFLRFVRQPKLVERLNNGESAYPERVWIDWVFSIRVEGEDGKVERKLVELRAGMQRESSWHRRYRLSARLF
ncbi:hypothetical protein OQA88_12676 [Cercophora sp. LCS_1]